MAITVFGVVHGSIRDHHFPQQQQSFGATSKPTATVVGEMIDASAAVLAGKLRAESITPSSITTTYAEAYAWCAEAVRIGAAIRAFPAMTGQDPEVLKAWRATLDAKWADLDERGYLALGDAPAPTVPADGPTTHINEHSLDTGDTADISSVIPRFRRDDQL